MSCALVAIAKDEGPYIREWVLYHKMVCGFDEIIVYENDSSDETRSQLEKMASEGLCIWRDWPRARHDPPQQTAYADALAHISGREWMCFLDIDEFLVVNSHEPIGEFVSGFDASTGSISFNWVMFYSLDKAGGPEPVTKRVRLCQGNPHVKTIARVSAAKGCGIHTFDLKPGFKYLHCSGREYALDDTDLALDAKICTVKENQIVDFRTAQVNHYIMKSEQEVADKDRRGRATTRGYSPKNIMGPYSRLVSNARHITDGKIFDYIERRIGEESFYDKVTGGKK